MTGLPTIGYGKTYTNRKVLWQDIPNTHLDFTSSGFYQDFTLFSIPANHMIYGVKMSVLVNFDAGTDVTATMYVGNEHTILSSPTSPNYVSDVHDCFGVANLTIPSGIGATYGYGSFRWFNFSSPGSTSAISQAYCIPERTDAQNIIARVVVTQTGGISVSSIVAGAVEITAEYGAF
jgi:hypothetical protein